MVGWCIDFTFFLSVRIIETMNTTNQTDRQTTQNNRFCAIDFEYAQGDMPHPKLVCCCLKVDDDSESPNDSSTERYWLYDGSDKPKLVQRLFGLIVDRTIFIAHAVELAEGRCFNELGFHTPNIRWFDTFLAEHIVNNKAKLSKSTSRSLLACLERHKLIDKEDTPEMAEHKERMRKAIVDEDNLDAIKEDVMDYCASDIHLLKALAFAQLRFFHDKVEVPLFNGEMSNQFFGKDCSSRINALEPLDMILDYSHKAWLFSIIDARGIPLKSDEVGVFLSKSKSGLLELKKKFNIEVFPIYTFKVKKGELNVSASRNQIQTFIRGIKDENHISNWPLSEKTGLLSTRDEFLQEYENLDVRLKKFREHKKMCKAISSFAKDGSKNWLSTYDPTTSRVYPYHGFGQTQTFRNAHKGSMGFVPAWSKAMRTLQHPKRGRSLIAVDFSSEEFILGMDLRHDPEGVKAYNAGDIYVATAKKMGLLPMDKPYDPKTQKPIRQQAKALVLGLGYGMGKKRLAAQLGVDEDKAGELVAKYKKIYSGLFTSISATTDMLHAGKTILFLPNGYNIVCPKLGDMAKDADDDEGSRRVARYEKSVNNFPIQCGGAFILGEIVERCFKEKLNLIATIHDEVVVECADDEVEDVKRRLMDIMVDSYECLTGTRNVRVSPEVWGGEVRCDHLEDGNKTYFGLLETLKSAKDDDNIQFHDGEFYVDEDFDVVSDN